MFLHRPDSIVYTQIPMQVLSQQIAEMQVPEGAITLKGRERIIPDVCYPVNHLF